MLLLMLLLWLLAGSRTAAGRGRGSDVAVRLRIAAGRKEAPELPVLPGLPPVGAGEAAGPNNPPLPMAGARSGDVCGCSWRTNVGGEVLFVRGGGAAPGDPAGDAAAGLGERSQGGTWA
jgi:hypothetical protein